MQLIEPSIQLITETDPYKKIEMAARTCYKSEKNITEESAKRMVNNLINNQHYAMLEHVNFIFEITGELADDLFEYCKTFKYLNCTYNINARRYLVSGNLRALNESNIIILLETLKIKHPELAYNINSVCPYQDINNGILILIVSLDQYSDLSEEEIAAHRYTTMKFVTDRGVSHELVRHRPFSFAQESTRYVKYGKDNTDILFIKPTDYNNWDWRRQTRFVTACTQSEENYNYMINEGATPQEARAVLPNALKTEIVVTGNDAEWQHFFNLRSIGTTGKPHPDMKKVADMALTLYNNHYGKQV